MTPASYAPAQILPWEPGASKPYPARRRRHSVERLRSLIAGAGRPGQAIARDLLRIPEFGLVPVGFVDDAPTLKLIRGLPVFGHTAEIPRLALQHRIDVLVIAMPSVPQGQLRRLNDLAASAGLSVRRLPSLAAALERDAHAADLRRLRIDHLLGRPEVRVISLASRSVVEGKRVLVTGAGGSIGSELCRQIAAFNPAAQYLLDHDESNLHRLQLEITGEALLESEELIIADIRDRERMRQIFGDTRPQVVFHAAAHKHLPLLERHPCEGVKSNVLGTRNVVKAALEAGVEKLILISTDKAADPASVLGATKRIGEMLLQAHAGQGTQFASVRFGNVLGSRGSFLSVLSEQFEKDREITVTHPDMTRFFMTVGEAAGLVLEAAVMADAGETFALDMGEQVRIVDLVRNYAAQFDVPPEAIKIRYTGLRPGEKVSEALFSATEQRTPTGHPRIWATTSRPFQPDFACRVEHLVQAAVRNEAAEVRRLLADIVPEYRPAEWSGAISFNPYPDDF